MTTPANNPNPQQPEGDSAVFGWGAEWLKAEGNAIDVVVSSRVRLARNVAGLPFAPRASPRDRQRVLDLCRQRIMNAELAPRMVWVDLHGASSLDRSLLVERHLISKQHQKGRGQGPQADPRAVAISLPDERVSVMVNEEDHLRIQILRAGLSLSQAWSEMDQVDDKIESGLEYAYSPRFGYLTACPTNVGTGLRMSCMLHLPGLRLTGEIDKVKRAAQDMGLAVRGFFGEGSEAVGDLYQISNQVTLGKAEAQVLKELEQQIIPRVVEYERISRRELLTRRPFALADQVWRAWGLLTNARLLTTDEAMQALSLIRLGVVTGVLNLSPGQAQPAQRPTPGTEQFPQTAQLPALQHLGRIMLLVQPAHLQRAVKLEQDQEQRRVARAALVRAELTRLL